MTDSVPKHPTGPVGYSWKENLIQGFLPTLASLAAILPRCFPMYRSAFI